MPILSAPEGHEALPVDTIPQLVHLPHFNEVHCIGRIDECEHHLDDVEGEEHPDPVLIGKERKDRSVPHYAHYPVKDSFKVWLHGD